MIAGLTLALLTTLTAALYLYNRNGKLSSELFDAKRRAAEKIAKDPPRVYFKGRLISASIGGASDRVALSFFFHQDGTSRDYQFNIETDPFTAKRFEVGKPITCYIELS